MASILTPLQLTATAGLLQNQGLKTLPSALTTAIANFNATGLITDWLAAVAAYKASSFFTQSTFEDLLQIGSTVCPALGNSIPESPVGTYSNLIAEYIYDPTLVGQCVDPNGFSNLIEQTGNAYLGVGSASIFAQGFMAVESYVATVNQYINTSVNSTTYLGPLFSSMDDLITNSVSSINSDLAAFGKDLAMQGNLWDLGKIELYGTPAGLLQSIAKQGKLQGGTLESISRRLINVGFSATDIKDIVDDNRAGLFNPNGLSDNEFNKLQQRAYQAIASISGTDLQEILAILDVTTPNITTLGDLFNPVKTFPNSYGTMTLPTVNGNQPIYVNGSVNGGITPTVAGTLPTASGCDELGKIIPPDQAVANKAIQIAFQNITGIINTTLPAFAQAVNGYTDQIWNSNSQYLANSLVSYNGQVYQAIDTVPVGTNIIDTNYWRPTTLGGIDTLTGLNLIQNLTVPVDPSVTTYFTNTIATGSGPNGEITIYDVLGTAVDYNDFAAQLNAATTQIDALQTAGALTTLRSRYTTIASAVNDAAVVAAIANANSDISTIAGSYPTQVASLNTAWNSIATVLNTERGYQNAGGIDYFVLATGSETSIFSFVQNISRYAVQTASEQSAEFIEAIADTTTLTGQAIVGSMIEARNSERLNLANIPNTGNQIPSNPPLIPVPVVN